MSGLTLFTLKEPSVSLKNLYRNVWLIIACVEVIDLILHIPSLMNILQNEQLMKYE